MLKSQIDLFHSVHNNGSNKFMIVRNYFCLY